MTHDPRVEAAALDWVIRQRDPAFEAWDASGDWLAQDPAHADVYHELAALDADMAALPAEPDAPVEADEPADASETGNVVPLAPRRMTRRVWLSGAIAASLVGMVSVSLLNRAPDSYRVETAMGETQQVTLADGSRISVNGGSSVLLSHADPRMATLERGQALFSVVHREDAPFRVAVGQSQLVDVGTVFDVTRVGDRTVVAVSEGAVVYNPGADNVRVDAGRRLAVNDKTSDADLRAISPDAVGGWQGGQLVYDGVSLADVAAEVERTTGIKVRTTAGTSGLLFRGALQTGDDPERLVRDLAALSGTRATQDAGGWTLSR